MKTSIFYIVNAGLYFYFDGTGILIDGVHDGWKKGFSPMPARAEQDLRHHTGIFSDLRGALFTHLHDDHFSRKRLDYMMQFSGHLSVYGPELSCSNVRFSNSDAASCSFAIDKVQILAASNTHDGDPYRNEPHRSLFLTYAEDSFFIAGDAILDPGELPRIYDHIHTPVTAAFVNMFQAASPAGREYLRLLKPERVFLYHMPFPEDDEANYWRWARQLVRKWPSDLPKLEIPEPMAWIDDNRIVQDFRRII